MPWPAMSGAEPCWAWATQMVSPALTDPPRPRLPDSSEASSERMSPNMLVVTTTSNRSGLRMSSAAVASTMSSSSSTSGKSAATLRTSRRNSPSDSLSTLALWTAVTFPRRPRASSKAARATLSQAPALILRTDRARSASGMNSPLPACMLRSE